MAVLVKGGGGKPEEEKTVTAGTSTKVVTPSNGKTIKKVTVNPTPSQSKTVTPSTSQQTVSPDSGKLLSKVIVKAMEDVTPEVTAQTPVITQIAENLGVTITTPSGTNKQILQGNNANLQLIAGYEPPFKIVTWAGGTDEEIVAMVAAADAGLINLSDYWAVGDTRTVQLSAMSATGVGESHAAQQVHVVLSHKGGQTLEDGSTCTFQWDFVEALAETGYMNSSRTNSGGYDGSARAQWNDTVMYNALPAWLKKITKPFKVTSDVGGGATSGLQTAVHKLALRAEYEVFGTKTYSFADEATALTQVDYYKTAINRNKKYGINGSVGDWWLRSSASSYSGIFCRVANDDPSNSFANSNCGIAPFGCI